MALLTGPITEALSTLSSKPATNIYATAVRARFHLRRAVPKDASTFEDIFEAQPLKALRQSRAATNMELRR